MKIDKSLEEVREWKRLAAQELEGLTPEEQFEKIRRDAEEVEKKYNLKLRKLVLTR